MEIYYAGTNIASYSIWGNWVKYDASTADASSVWCPWVTATAGSTATTTNVIWNGWQTKYQPYSPGEQNRRYVYEAPPETPEEQTARLELAARAEAARREAVRVTAKAHEAAEDRARELLLSHLGPEQKRRFEKDRVFEVLAMSGRRYRITLGWAGNVVELDAQDRPTSRFCIHPRQQVPVHDNLLAQKLMLETDEERFLKTANRTPILCN